MLVGDSVWWMNRQWTVASCPFPGMIGLVCEEEHVGPFYVWPDRVIHVTEASLSC